MRRLSKAVALTLAVAMLLGAASLAHARGRPTNEASDFDNWRAEFGGNDEADFEDNDYGDAGGSVIANYVKGPGSFVVSIDVHGLEPGMEYMLVFTKQIDDDWSPVTIGYFTADDEGYGTLTVQGWRMEEDVTGYIEPTSEDSHFNIFRYDDGRVNPWVLSTYSERTDYPLDDAGSNRGE